MASMSCEVNFRVRSKTRPGETVCLVGDTPELGGWDPHRAVILHCEMGRPNESKFCPEEHSEEGDIWSKSVHLEGSNIQHYRYFICRLHQSDREGDCRRVLVREWEGHIRPRRVSLTEEISKASEGDNKLIDVFGHYDGLHVINRGWLIDHVEIQLQLEGEAIQMWKSKHKEQLYSIKCTPIDNSCRKTKGGTFDCEPIGDTLPQSIPTEIEVSFLEKGKSKPRPQLAFGAIFRPDGFMTFYAQTYDPESLGFHLDFYVHSSPAGTDREPEHVGSSFILPIDLQNARGEQKVPINGLSNMPIGILSFKYLIVKPMCGGPGFDMRRTFQSYLKTTRRPLDVGHRGLGSSYKSKKLATMRENTIGSFQGAANHGADFVEFDVHLTKDEVPVIYHDLKALITYRKKKSEELELFEIPVKDLMFDQLRNMKLSHPALQAEYKYEGIHDNDLDTVDLQPFPSLEQAFQSVDIHTGFNIEVKFPQTKIDGTGNLSGYFDMNRFVDIILASVFKNHSGRRIIFSSFEPDVCTMLQLKQNVYPVLFLSQACTTRYVPYAGIKNQSVVMAAEFALSAGLLGVDLVSDILVNEMWLIKYIKDAGLVLFVWGEGCNDKSVIQEFKDNKVDGVIFDRIDFYKTGEKESIFKIEERQKCK
ncbi:glycerophosphocholine phosphodiesterase GPCPD1-like [Dreissena polymorpha]|nr:glycerophosphocholine phosphodiesterase GPCPD1-like [Dreissena polymorpha]